MHYDRVHIVIGDSPWVDTAKRVLENEGAVQVQFVNQTNWYEKRKEVFHNFKGIDISIERKSRTEAHVLLVNERIRTSFLESKGDLDPKQKSAEQLHYPAELSLKSRGSLDDFDFDTFDGDTIVEIDGVKVYPCACCGRYLPEDSFGLRHYGQLTFRQSYCKKCQGHYNYWRHIFLRDHQAERLTPTFTEGNRQRNEIFRAWYAENVED